MKREGWRGLGMLEAGMRRFGCLAEEGRGVEMTQRRSNRRMGKSNGDGCSSSEDAWGGDAFMQRNA
jgi:hypothetical protein